MWWLGRRSKRVGTSHVEWETWSVATGSSVTLWWPEQPFVSVTFYTGRPLRNEFKRIPSLAFFVPVWEALLHVSLTLCEPNSLSYELISSDTLPFVVLTWVWFVLLRRRMSLRIFGAWILFGLMCEHQSNSIPIFKLSLHCHNVRPSPWTADGLGGRGRAGYEHLP